MSDTEADTARYITIAELWECRDCDIEGGYGFLGRIVHELRYHMLGDGNE